MKIHQNSYAFPTIFFSFPMFGMIWMIVSVVILTTARILSATESSAFPELPEPDYVIPILLFLLGLGTSYFSSEVKSGVDHMSPGASVWFGTTISLFVNCILWAWFDSVGMDTKLERYISAFRIVYFGFWLAQYIGLARWLARKVTV